MPWCSFLLAAALLNAAEPPLEAAKQGSLTLPASPLSTAREAAAADPAPVAAAPLEVGSYSFQQLMGLPNGLRRAEVETMIQRFTDSQRGRSFRHLGDEHDFDHGHFLYAPDRYDRPIAVLFHTQEHASRFTREDPGGRYDYVDRSARNLLYFMDTGRIENASAYERTSYPDEPRYARRRAWLNDPRRTVGNEVFTIHAGMLDAGRLGFDIGMYEDLTRGPGKPNQLMFSFRKVDCARLPAELPADHNILRIRVSETETACLALTAN